MPKRLMATKIKIVEEIRIRCEIFKGILGFVNYLKILKKFFRHYPINCVNDNAKEKSIVKFKD